jgi:hypothetical protein
MSSAQPISGHVCGYEGKRRTVWRAKYRLPDGRQVQKTLGPAWTSRGRPSAGYWTKRTAEAWLRPPPRRGRRAASLAWPARNDEQFAVAGVRLRWE